MHETYHDNFHDVDDHNELRQGEASMADAWQTKDWADRHFAEGLGFWEVNVYKATVYFQHSTLNHNEFRKRLAHAFLTLGKHEYGTPLSPPAAEPAAAEPPATDTSSGTPCTHTFSTFSKLSGKRCEGYTCGYCPCPKAYLRCTTCFPQGTEARYAICSPDTGRDCIAKHILGVPHSYTKNKEKEPTRKDDLRPTPEDQARREQKRTAASMGGAATQKAKKTKSATGGAQ